MKKIFILLFFLVFTICVFAEESKTEVLDSAIFPKENEESKTSLNLEEKPTFEKERVLDLKTAEEKLWRNNLLLLASRFNIDARKAGIEQAGLYANPNIFIDQSIYAEPTQRYFDFSRSGQTVVQIQQLFC